MEKVANAGTHAGNRGETLLRSCAALMILATAGPAARAEAERPPGPPVVLAEARSEQQPVRLQVEASALPRLDARDSGFQGPRLDLSLVPENARGTGLGPVLGMRSTPAQGPAGIGFAPGRAGIDLGLRFSHRLQNDHQIDVTAWRRMDSPDDAYSLIQRQEPVYGARVEMRLKPAKFGAFGFDRGLLGFQLESGARISIKRKDGRPMIYYRTTF